MSNLPSRPSKKVSESALVSAYLMRPEHANPSGNVYGGSIMQLMDGVAGSVAQRHTRMNVVTASVDRMDFFKPVYISDLLILKASVNYVGNTSMEIGVKIEAENMRTGRTVHTGSCYLTFVALDKDGLPTIVPDLITDTDTEKRRYNEGKLRRQQRLVTAKKNA